MAKNECSDNLERLDFGQDPGLRRELHSNYLAVRKLTSEKRDDSVSSHSKKLDLVIDIVDKLHEQVQLPREQLADAQALWDITSAVVDSVKSHSNNEIAPESFISGVITQFGQVNMSLLNKECTNVSLRWKDIGLSVTPSFRRSQGCCTMLGPMNVVVKQRKAAVSRTKPTTTHLPKEINNEAGERTDTDANMSTMFEILKKKKEVELSCLILNRRSFAQTVENIFTLSFLAKDGRVRIAVEDGIFIVSPTNAPVANVCPRIFILFALQLLMDMVAVGEELMPHRNHKNCTPPSKEEPAAYNSQAATSPHTAIRKLTRNHGLVAQEKPTAEESFENDDASGATALRSCKRKLSFNTFVSGSLS